jgi:hypothetical protein
MKWRPYFGILSIQELNKSNVMKLITPILFSILLLGSCGSPRYLSAPNDFSYNVKGLILSVTLDDKTHFLGEIIEANNTELLILPIDKAIDGMVTIPKNKIQSADIIISTTSDNPGGLTTWAGLINLAPLGHGFFGILTVPINVVSTVSIAATANKSTYRMKYPDNVSWSQISKFARFPQGIPEQIDRSQIR